MTKNAGIAVGLLAGFVLVACYNTANVTNGGLVCGPDNACPDGFKCLQNHCWRNGTGPDAGAQACAVGSGKFGPFATCSPAQVIPDSTCDPVCQAGCACDRRCTIEPYTLASFHCETAPPPATFVPVQGTCTNNANSCEPGSLCISDDVCPWQCFRMCRKDVDCPGNSRCSAIGPVDITGEPVRNVWLCTPQTEVCSPTGAADCASPRAGFKCVFLAGLTGVANTDATVCDCATLHDKRIGAGCSAEPPDDCQPGAVCVDGVCRQVCDRQGSGASCSSGGACNPIYDSARYGYCR
jgi:hypothetical protein